MAQPSLKDTAATAHRIDLACEKAGFSTPPCDVRLKLLPPASGTGWTLLAHSTAGKPVLLAQWLRSHPSVEELQMAAGPVPRLLRAKAAASPEAWATVAAHARVHHLDLGPDGHASWFVEGVRSRIAALVRHLEPVADRSAGGVRCRPVHAGGAPISRRQFETLCTAVALGYYEIPHHIDLRTLATRSGVSLGSASELLRRAEGAVLTHFVDSSLLGLPTADGAVAQFKPLDDLLRP